MDMIFYGRSTSMFRAAQQWVTTSSQPMTIRLGSQLSPMNCQTFCVQFSSGERGGRNIKMTLSDTFSLGVFRPKLFLPNE
ncbi:hypothetical protein [Rhizobium sullae]|uniref:Uncharacterized protein n=1 Tax=Rhizobium sullae TaxID=50338 RepID=A0A4R3Q2X3_RHISU|nr:hypothetical protein [Rhizobium sullae]TCU15341.1 hypothetical protein EV132_107241 [Rhizobium sullae]